MNTPTSESRISNISVKPASKQLRGPDRQNRFSSSSTAGAHSVQQAPIASSGKMEDRRGDLVSTGAASLFPQS